MKTNSSRAAIWATWIFSLFFAAVFVLCVALPPKEISVSERRKLAQFPEWNRETIKSARAMSEFEDYALDQFPFRERFRSIKAQTSFYVFQKKDNNGIYVAQGTVSKLDFPLDEDSVRHATERFRSIYEKNLKNTDAQIYFAIVPDKNYYLAQKNGFPHMDYEKMYQIIQRDVYFATHIDLRDCLSTDDYYLTDTHWKQSKIQRSVDFIASSMGVLDRLTHQYEYHTFEPFYGVYYGQAALPLAPDTLQYLTNDAIENAQVMDYASQSIPVYQTKELESNDPYNVFLSGSQPLLTITNPLAEDDRELILFRDSFGSSLTPLLIEAYAKIIVIDIRYVAADVLARFVDFSQADDVLFLYSTLILNNSGALK